MVLDADAVDDLVAEHRAQLGVGVAPVRPGRDQDHDVLEPDQPSSSARIAGITTSRGCGRVPSQTLIATLWPGRTQARSGRPATGSRSAVVTARVSSATGGRCTGSTVVVALEAAPRPEAPGAVLQLDVHELFHHAHTVGARPFDRAGAREEVRVILVTGATGNVEAEVLRALTRAGRSVRALVRDASRGDLPAEVEEVEGDLDDPSSLAGPLAGVRGVFLLPGYKDMPASSPRSAASASSESCSSRAPPRRAATRATRHGVHDAIRGRRARFGRAVDDPAGLRLMSNTLRWTEQLQQGDTVSEPFADVPSAMVDPFDIGEVAARALTSDADEGTTHLVSGGEAIVPAEQGADPRPRAPSQPPAARTVERRGARADALLDAGGVRRRVLRLLRGGVTRRVAAQATVRDVLGRPPRTFEEWAREHASAFS